jgi:hypothetical protein
MSMLSTLSDIIKSCGQPLPIVTYEGRIAACAACGNSETAAFGLACSLCGCNMNIKARFLASKCPENRWTEIDAESYNK